jgi:DNA invertase Pin-like site-specific DNA recombinase
MRALAPPWQPKWRSSDARWRDILRQRLMLTILGGLAEFERELIRGRTGEGRERAKARGVIMGRRSNRLILRLRAACSNLCAQKRSLNHRCGSPFAL